MNPNYIKFTNLEYFDAVDRILWVFFQMFGDVAYVPIKCYTAKLKQMGILIGKIIKTIKLCHI